MKELQFEKEIWKIQNFLSLNDWDISYRLVDNTWFTWELTYVDYLRFKASLSFDKKILEQSELQIKSIIMHELCHIFTIMNLRQFEEDTYLKWFIWDMIHSGIIEKMNILNEQMTVRLEKILTELYKDR